MVYFSKFHVFFERAKGKMLSSRASLKQLEGREASWDGNMSFVTLLCKSFVQGM